MADVKEGFLTISAIDTSRFSPEERERLRHYFDPAVRVDYHDVQRLPTGDDGNPVFDFTTKRTVYIRPVVKDAMIPKRESFIELSSYYDRTMSRETKFMEYEVNSKGEVLLDEGGDPKVKTDGKGKELSFYLYAPPGGQVAIQLPKEGYKIRQILRDPLNMSVEFIDGQRNYVASKRDSYFIYDEQFEKKRRTESKRSITEAKEFLKTIHPDLLFAYALVLGLTQDLSDTADTDDLRFALEDLAREAPHEIIDNLRDNPNIGNQILMALAKKNHVIQFRGASGYLYYPAVGKALPLGISQEQAMSYLLDNPRILEDVVSRSGFSLISAHLPDLHPSVRDASSVGDGKAELESTRALQEELARELKEIRELKKLLLETASNSEEPTKKRK